MNINLNCLREVLWIYPFVWIVKFLIVFFFVLKQALYLATSPVRSTCHLPPSWNPQGSFWPMRTCPDDSGKPSSDWASRCGPPALVAWRRALLFWLLSGSDTRACAFMTALGPSGLKEHLLKTSSLKERERKCETGDSVRGGSSQC